MKLKKIAPYLKDREGNLSSTRLFSFYLLRFFIVFNSLSMPSFLGIAYLFRNDTTGGGLSVMGFVIISWLVFNAILGIMIFAPKQFNKVSEIRALIAIATGNGRDKSGPSCAE